MRTRSRCTGLPNKPLTRWAFRSSPSVKSLNAQYARLLGEKKAAYAEYRAAREEMRELMVHRKNLALILQGDAKEGKGKEAEWEGR